MTISARLWFRVGLTIVGAFLALAAAAVAGASLRDPAFVTGWLLAAGIVFLILYNARKKLPFLPLGSAAGWLRLHVYIGWLCAFLFLVHIDFRVPDGALEVALAIFFTLVVLSGIVGTIIARLLPMRLTRRGEEVIFERIPAFRAQLRQEADELVLRSVSETEATTIADFYAARLKRFFDRPRDFFNHLFELNPSRFAILNEMAAVERYLNDRERQFLAELAALVRQKDDLDYHHALQATLKVWLFAHIPLSYGLLVLIAAHVVLAYAFTGGTA